MLLQFDWLVNAVQHQPCGRYLGCQLSSVSPASRQSDLDLSGSSSPVTRLMSSYKQLCLDHVVEPGLDSNAKNRVFQEPTLPWVSLLLRTTWCRPTPRVELSLSAGPSDTCSFLFLTGQNLPRAKTLIWDWWSGACYQTEEVYTLLEVWSYKHSSDRTTW